MPIPGCIAINSSKSKMLTVIGAIRIKPKALVFGMNMAMANNTSNIFTTNKNFVVNKIPKNVPAVPATGGIGINLKKQFEPKTR